jgi:hypothetical protein
LNVILNCVRRLYINNEKLKNGLSMINNNYLFEDCTDPAKNSNDKSSKKPRLAFNTFGMVNTDTESAASSSTNNSRNKQRWKNGNQYHNELENYKSHIEALQSELNNLKLRSPVNRINHGKIVKLERKSKNKNLNHIKSKEDESIHDPREEYNSEDDRRNMISRHEAQYSVPNVYGVQLEDCSFGGEFNPEQKSDMQNKL